MLRDRQIVLPSIARAADGVIFAPSVHVRSGSFATVSAVRAMSAFRPDSDRASG